MDEQDQVSKEDPEEDPAEGQQPRQESSRKSDPFVERTRHAYLFHMWAEPRRGGKEPIWRFSLEEVESGARHGFGNFDTLVGFLRQRMAAG